MDSGLELDNTCALTTMLGPFGRRWPVRGLRDETAPRSITSNCSGLREAGSRFAEFRALPGRAYDRSPCGNRHQAKVACLAADAVLPEGRRWRQQSIVGSVFEATYRRHGDQIIPWSPAAPT